MNKPKLKSYAPQARRDFIQMIRQRADLLGLTKTEITPAKIEGNIALIEGRPYPKNYAAHHARVAATIRVEGLESFIERVAYSWFNRIAALRFMEINGFLSHGFRVLSNSDASKNEPEILRHAAEIELAGVDKSKVLEMQLAGNKDAELYKILLIAQCNELHRAMPFLFERVGDETEMLLPDNLLNSDSVIRKMTAAIDEADWQEVEIIGWLYQFYISEKKDEVIGKTVKSEDIPAATQLFTPNWIVKYMTQNSLGRLWLEANPHSLLASQMEFFIKPEESIHETHEGTPSKSEENSVREFSVISGQKETIHEIHEKTLSKSEEENKNSVREFSVIGGRKEAIHETHEGTLNKSEENSFRDFSVISGQSSPEEIKVLDPACGSGHILVEAYELLKAIYLERGYVSRDIPLLILENNLFGLDIDERAAQMASFALLMKARKDDRRIFEKLNKTVHEIHEKTLNRSEEENRNSSREFSVISGRIPNILTVPDSSHIGYTPAQIAELFFSREAQTNGAVPIRESNFLSNDFETQPSLMLANNSEQSQIANRQSQIEVTEQNVIDLLELFAQGRTLGSLVRIPHGFGGRTVHESHEKALNKTEKNSFRDFSVFSGQSSSGESVLDRIEGACEAKRAGGDMNEQVAVKLVAPFVRAAQMLARRYDCVIANPPYMGGKGMNGELKAFAAKNFPDSKSDLFAMFIERNIELTKKDGFLGFMTPFVWMFLSSYEKLRSRITSDKTILSLVRPEYHAFFESAFVPICSFVLSNQDRKTKGEFFDLSEFYGAELQPTKFLEAIEISSSSWRFQASSKDFERIPGSPIAYWVSDKVREVFEKGISLGEIAAPRKGNTTTDNNRFLRFWSEVSNIRSGIGFESSKAALDNKKKWIPYNKGGGWRKWYGFNEFLVNWENNGQEIRSIPHSVIANESFFFKSGLTWSTITSSNFSVREFGQGFIFDNGGCCIFELGENKNYICALLNSKVFENIFAKINPTLNFQSGEVAKFPVLEINQDNKNQIKQNATEAVAIARADWDSFETSWDFKRLPMLSNYELRITNYELKDGSNIVADEHSPLTDEHSHLTDERSYLTDEDSPAADEHSRITGEDSQPSDEGSHLTDGHSQMTDEDSQGTDGHLQVSDEDLQAMDGHSHPAVSANERGKNTVHETHEETRNETEENLVSFRAFRGQSSSVEAAWNNWKQLCDWRIARMQTLETENNRLFIEAYGLADELSPEVPLSQITLMRADAEKDVRRLLSYFIACLMGRYSLDRDGLIYADAGGKGFDASQYRTFAADDDGIVPVTDTEWFEQEAARQFERFIRAAFFSDFSVISGREKEAVHEPHEKTRNKTEDESKSSFRDFSVISGQSSSHEKNMQWIGEQLGAKANETPVETVRRYFSTAFFKDHLQTYKKRPIYWLFSSGKQKAFECLVYLHRYNESTLPRMRHEYVLPLMSKLTAQIELAESLIEKAESTSEKTKLTKQKEIYTKKQTELAAFDEKLRHYSDLRISLDLDDGVKVNYGKFGDLLAEVKQVATTKE